ncbi:hypothetical protein Tsp_02007, partial [Trichinella spiralis]|uniref:hypothetical protein n=1 Tax=Trichinella spiralis TaxID=6334 RepID=UPI0001EFBAC6
CVIWRIFSWKRTSSWPAAVNAWAWMIFTSTLPNCTTFCCRFGHGTPTRPGTVPVPNGTRTPTAVPT